MSYDGVPKYSTVAERGSDPPSSVSDRTCDAMEGWFNIVPHPANTPRSVVGGFLKAMPRRRGLPCPGVEEAVAAKLILVRRWLRLIEALRLLVKIHKIVASEIWCKCYLPFAYSSRLQMVLNPGKILHDSSHLQPGVTFDASHMQTDVSVEVHDASRCDTSD